MSNLSEEEIIKILNKLQDRQFVLKNLSTDGILVFGETEKLAIQGLLDLYNKEKEKNKKQFNILCKYEDKLEIYENKVFKEINNYIDLDELLKLDEISIQGNKYISQKKYDEKIIKIYNNLLKEFCQDYISKHKIREKLKEYLEMLKTCNKKADIERIKAINERILAYEELLQEK